MRFTITKKVVISLMILLVIGTASMLIIYNGLNKVKMSIIELTDEKEPVLTAANEMEINMNGIAVVVLRYLNTTNPRYRQRMKKDEEDYRQFQDQYFQFIRDQKLREWGFIVDLLYRDFLILGREMMDKKDKQESIFLTVAENFEYMDEIIDQKYSRL
jgi:CHASE3 domain sensor protein